MRIPKKYGQSRIESCPFCGKRAVQQNKQGVPVCSAHKNDPLPDFKCACGSWLDLQSGKWGPYFRCMNCGNVNFKKALEMNPPKKASPPPSTPKKKTETILRSDELDIF